MAAVGLMLIIKGIWTWGIAFVVAGVAVWGITEFAVGEFSEDPIVNALVKIMGIAGTALLAIGIILCVFGVITPVSIGMIVAGAGMLVSAVALNSEAIVEAIRGPIGIIMAIVSGALLVLGIILVCTGVGIPLGIGLILAGATGLATVVAVNWDSIVGAVQNAWNAIKEWVTTYGMLVIGILLCLTGVGIPFGIGIIADWAKSGAAKGVPLAETIVEKVKSTWNAVKSFWNANIAPIFTVSWWLALGKNCINGLITGFEGGINGIINAFEAMINFIVDGLNKISFDVPDWVPFVGGNKWGINIPRANFADIKIPRLAKGEVIPPNREFLAVLGDQKQGTNIETPLATMVEAFNIALNNRGNDTVKEEHYYLDESEVMRIIYRLAKKGEQAQGDDLLESW